MSRPKIRYEKAPGCPFSEADIRKIIGPTLHRIAKKHQHNDIASLDDATIFAEVEADPKHPLRRFYEWDVNKAARKTWLEQTRKLRSAVRIVRLDLPRRSKPEPQFIYIKPSERAKGSQHRSHVLTADAIEKIDDPAFVSALSTIIKEIRPAVNKLRHLVSLRPASQVPEDIRELANALSQAMAKYEEASREAAE